MARCGARRVSFVCTTWHGRCHRWRTGRANGGSDARLDGQPREHHQPQHQQFFCGPAHRGGQSSDGPRHDPRDFRSCRGNGAGFFAADCFCCFCIRRRDWRRQQLRSRDQRCRAGTAPSDDVPPSGQHFRGRADRCRPAKLGGTCGCHFRARTGRSVAFDQSECAIFQL